MTPEDVVARAQELEGQEVLLTVRGVVTRSRGSLIVRMPQAGAWDIGLAFDHDNLTNRDLVSIEPAPMRVEMGALYEVPGIGLCRGQAGGGLWALYSARAIAADTVSSFGGIKRVKIVDA